jgi:transketolase
MRAEFAKLCLETVKTDSKSIVMVGDISHFLLRETEKVAPDRFYNIGICEQTMVSMASGMAIEGMKPIVHTIAPFLVERAYEQIKNDLGYQHTDVTIVTVGGTYDYSDLGCTHHCYGDIALMRLIPNMEVYEPATPKELRDLFLQTWGNGNPKYFRLSAHTHNQDLNVKAGEVNIVRNSTNGKYVFVTGHLLDDVLESTRGHGVIYVSTLHEISKNSIEKIYSMFSTEDTFLFSVENHFKVGGLGDLISDTFNLPVTRIGLDRNFLTDYGSYDDLRKQGNIDKLSIYQKLRRI